MIWVIKTRDIKYLSLFKTLGQQIKHMSQIQDSHQPQALIEPGYQQKYESLKLKFYQEKEQLKKVEEADPQVLIELTKYEEMIENLQRQVNECQASNTNDNYQSDNAVYQRQISMLQEQLGNKKETLNRLDQQTKNIVDSSENPEIIEANNEKQCLINSINTARQLSLKNSDNIKKQGQLAQQLRKTNENIQVKIRQAEQQQIEANISVNNFKQQLLELQNKFAQLQKQIVEAKIVSKASYNNQQRLQAKEAQYQDFERNKKKLIDDISQKKSEQELEKGKTVVLFNKTNQADQKLKQVQQSIQLLQKQFQQIRDKLNEQTKKAKQLKQSKQKVIKKQKPKNEAKILIGSLQNDNLQLEGDLVRQNRKLEQLIKIQKSYENPQRLHQLKAEYNQKNQIRVKQEQELKKNKKLIMENNTLKDRIQMLKDMAQKHFKERQHLLNEINQKILHKRQTKADIERQIEENSKRIQIYSSQFPRHQKQKQQRKLRAKKQKNESSLINKKSEQSTKAKQQQQQEQIEYLIQQPKNESFIAKVFSKILPN